MHARFGERALDTSGSNAARRQRSTLLRCESIHLKSHWVQVVMDQFTRRIIGFGVHAADVDGVALCRMFNTAISTRGVPKYLSSDHDPSLTYHQWTANLSILDVDEIKSVPYTPRSHPFVDLSEPFAGGFLTTPYSGMRSIWSASWNFLNDYYNHSRTHASLDGNRPVEISGDRVAQPAPLNSYAWKKHCGALFQLPVAA